MNSKIQHEHQSLNLSFIEQTNILLKDLEHILILTQIRANDIPYSRICQFCKFIHDYDEQHNLVIKQYSEAQFISDLIAEHQTLFEICNWAHQTLNFQNAGDQDKAWNHIISNNLQQVHNFLKDDEKCILNSLKPFGAGNQLFDFMKLSANQNENWVLTLETLNQVVTQNQYSNNKLYKWATCQSVPLSANMPKFYENLWLNIRAELFCKVMTRHSEIYPKMMQCINFGINKPYVWRPKYYELNFVSADFGVETLGKQFIYQIIKYLTKKSSVDQFIQLVEEAIYTLSNISIKIQDTKQRVLCFYKIGLMINNLLDIDEEDEYNLLKLLTEVIKLIEVENFDLHIKFKYLTQLLSFLKRSPTFNQFIFQTCQGIINQIGNSLSIILELLQQDKFESTLITEIAFDQFTILSPIQQNELISKEFSKYFDYEQKKTQIKRLYPYIIQNIELFKDTYPQLLLDYPDIALNETEYYQTYIKKDIESMKNFIIAKEIPDIWFIKYIIFILDQNNENDISDVILGITNKYEQFEKLENKRQILALIAKKLTVFSEFIDYLLK
ncbi:unnamed protein product [Paramecium sonneborni]|uniref:Uncharacterized protein n=1 Tax=Paramecium sonneborni TaxID=65129 RepID=A0A8S1KHH6_9CILI|nr:unnamed protein product [Paramecium sonneborni]